MKTFAVVNISTNIVENTIVAESKEIADLASNQVLVNEEIVLLDPLQFNCIEYKCPNIGDIYTNGEFSSAN
jgi:hypothetical protein